MSKQDSLSGFTNEQLECITLIDALENFSLCHRHLDYAFKHTNNKKKKASLAQSIRFCNTMYMETARALLDDKHVEEFIDIEAIKVIRDTLFEIASPEVH